VSSSPPAHLPSASRNTGGLHRRCLSSRNAAHPRPPAPVPGPHPHPSRDTGDLATEHISGLASLKTYYAGRTRITDRSLELLGRMSSLERLEFWECAALTEAGFADLSGLPRLREITIGGIPAIAKDAARLFPKKVRVTIG